MPVFIKQWLFNWFFEASCNKHDEGYAQGGDEIRRFECDYKFWLAMKRDAMKDDGLFRFVKYIIAWIYYLVARLFGRFIFTYR